MRIFKSNKFTLQLILIITRNTVASICSTLGIILLSKSKISTSKFFSENALPLKGALGGILGDISALLVKKIDAKNADREYSKDELKNDFLKGAIQGVLNSFAEEFISAYKTGNKIVRSILKKTAKTTMIAFSTLTENYKKPPLFLVASSKIASAEKYNKLQEKIEQTKIKDTNKISFYKKEETLAE